MTTTCTITTTATGGKCGKPAVYTFTSSRTGETFGECSEHTIEGPAPKPVAVKVPRNRSTAPFVLVRDGRIVGYAHSAGPAVAKRALKLGASIEDNVR